MDYSKDSNNKKRKQNKSIKNKAKNKLGTIFLRLFVIAVIVGVFAGAGGLLGIYMGIVDSSPTINIDDITPNSYTSIIYDGTGTEIDRLHGDENREYAKLAEIPVFLQNAIVSVEDERFYTHSGIDFKGMMRAAYVNIKERGLSEGASTITQQLIKNNILKSSEKKFQRKLQEQYMAIEYEKALVAKLGTKKAAKDYILEVYLNSIGLGHGNNGVKSAALYYFDKDLSELTLAECAAIAGITQNPVKLSPKTNPDDNNVRRTNILNKMFEQGMITEAQLEEALAEDVYSQVKEVFANNTSQYFHSYFVEQVISDIARDLQYQKNYTSAQAYNLIYSGGLSIYTTQDMEMQAIMDDSFLNDDLYPPKSFEIRVIYNLSVLNSKTNETSHYEKIGYVKNVDQIDAFVEKEKAALLIDGDEVIGEKVEKVPQPQAAMLIMDYRNGEVKALTGGRGDKTEYGQRPLNRATQSTRSPGSVFKVLAAFLPGIDTGRLTAATVIQDEPYKIGGYSPRNHWGATFRGSMTIRAAIRDSANVVTVRALTEYVGYQTSWDYLMNLGFTTLVEGENRNGRVVSDKGPSLALGGLTDGVNLLELTAAYGAIANDGLYIKPYLYTKVVDHSGNEILSNGPETKQVIKKQTAYILTDMMKDVVTAGTGGKARFKKVKMPIAGKTGTSSDDIDLMFSGYTPYYVASIWMGHDMPKKMSYGVSYHLLLWSDIMEKIHVGLENKPFVRPDGIVSATVCSLTGLLPSPGLCTSTVSDLFVPGTVPNEVCSNHLKVEICSVSGKLATEYCPKETVVESVFTKTPAKPLTSDKSPVALPGHDDFGAPTEICDMHTTHPEENPDGGTEVDPENNGVDFTDPALPVEEIPFDWNWNLNNNIEDQPGTVPNEGTNTDGGTTTDPNSGVTDNPPTIDGFNFSQP